MDGYIHWLHVVSQQVALNFASHYKLRKTKKKKNHNCSTLKRDLWDLIDKENEWINLVFLLQAISVICRFHNHTNS